MDTLRGDASIDIGCILKAGAFVVLDEAVVISDPDTALISFLLRLMQVLQPMGTATAISVPDYGAVIWG
jgi:hypothetical protein